MLNLPNKYFIWKLTFKIINLSSFPLSNFKNASFLLFRFTKSGSFMSSYVRGSEIFQLEHRLRCIILLTSWEEGRYSWESSGASSNVFCRTCSVKSNRLSFAIFVASPFTISATTLLIGINYNLSQMLLTIIYPQMLAKFHFPFLFIIDALHTLYCPNKNILHHFCSLLNMMCNQHWKFYKSI